ncbi:MAG: hypothetical protein J2P15_24260, partial [Micromonosporaceae bacterium]|nr:hypothetical protein [Micromonosporaceae bacterium]
GGRSSGSFELIFLLDGVSYVLLGGLLVGFGRATRREADATFSDGAGPAGVASDGSEPDVAAPPGPGYRILLRDRRLLAVTAVGGLVTLAATGQQTATFPLWSVRYGGVAPVVVGAAFTANTTTVVLLQLFVLRFFRRHRRTSAAAIACGCFGGCWLLALLAGTVPSPWNAVFVIAALAVFAVGETFLSPSLPAILNALATAGTRGRYNAVYGMVSQAGLAAAPILAGVSLQSRAHALFLYLLIATCLLAAFGSLRLRRLLPSDADYETATPEAAATADLVATDER